MSFLDNTRKPEGFGGKLMIGMMNLGHRALARWGLSFVSPSLSAQVLDCGCGGGANVKTLLQKCPKGRVFGVDYSPVCVESARRKNKAAIEEGRCEVAFARVEALPFEGRSFDLVTAFETVYFWPEIEGCFREVFRVLRCGGTFLICNECGAGAKDGAWEAVVDGMRVYRANDLKALLEQAGFCGVMVQQNNRGWLCLTAKKSG